MYFFILAGKWMGGVKEHRSLALEPTLDIS
jgi:hypothetical protein